MLTNDDSRPEREAGDVRDHLEGYITITSGKPSWDASGEESQRPQQRLGGLSPSEF